MRRADDVVGAASIAHTCKNIPFNFRLLCLNLSTLSNSSNHLLIYSSTINPKNAILSSHTAQDFLPRLRIIAKWINGRLWYSTSESNRTKSLQRPRKFDCAGGGNSSWWPKHVKTQHFSMSVSHLTFPVAVFIHATQKCWTAQHVSCASATTICELFGVQSLKCSNTLQSYDIKYTVEEAKNPYES